jgi:deoxyribodipyrimidine photo-lyase
VCVYVYDPELRENRLPGAAARWWLHESLRELNAALGALGGGLAMFRGPERQVIEAFAAGIGAIKVCWNRRYSVAQRETDAAIKATLRECGIAVSTFNGHLLREPWSVATRDARRPFQVFSAYWRAARREYSPEPPRPAPGRIDFFPVPESAPARVNDLSALALQPYAPDWAGGLRETWQCGEEAGQRQLQAFLAGALAGYASGRDIPAMHATSRLSPYLRFGNLSVRQVWYAALSAARASPAANPRAAPMVDASLDKFLDELGWREFSYYLFYHFAQLHQVNFRRQFDAMPWRADPEALRAWQRGETGYPLVDAGMRELWHTGFMHNRVRMVVASFLVKHLLIDWREGEAWFWDTLVDADEASNPASWQWVAGSGADAAPYFRIFNPVLQGQKFDPQGDYVRRWVPDLARLPGASIHAPWLVQPAQLAAASVRLGRDYPLPVVSHQHARMRALAAMKGCASAPIG